MPPPETKTSSAYIDVFLNEARQYLDRDDGRQRDLKKAYEFFKAAADIGSETAWYYLALFHRAGIVAPADENEFYACLEQARQIEQSRQRNKRDSLTSITSGPLHNALGVAHMEGAGCARNLRRASRFFKNAVMANDGQALNNLSLTVLEAVEEVREKVQMLIDVLGIVKEITPTVHRDAYDGDDEWAQNSEFLNSSRNLEFGTGNGIPANAIEQLTKIHSLCNALGEAAVRSMRSRAECGDYLRGMYNVAVACERGLAGPVTPEDIIKTYRVVARAPGYGPAQVALAKYVFWSMMKKSEGLCEDDVTSMHCDGFRYLHRAAEANHPEAQAIYAAIYREGAFNVEPSPAEAEACYRLAVDNGWRGDGTETVQSLISARSDYERFMQELVPEGRQIVSRRTSNRRRINNPSPPLRPPLNALGVSGRPPLPQRPAPRTDLYLTDPTEWPPYATQIPLDDAWIRAPLTGASTTASSTEAQGGQRRLHPIVDVPPPKPAHPLPQRATIGKSRIGKKAVMELAPGTSTSVSTLVEAASMHLTSCELVESRISSKPSIGGFQSGFDASTEPVMGTYRFSRRSRNLSDQEGAAPRPPFRIGSSALQSPSTRNDSPPSHAALPLPPPTALEEASLSSAGGGGGGNRSYHATWEEEISLPEGESKEKLRSESLPGMAFFESGGAIEAGTPASAITSQNKHKVASPVLRFADIANVQTTAAGSRRQLAFSLHEKALYLLGGNSPFPMILDLLTKSYCLYSLVYRKEPLEHHSILNTALQKLLEPTATTEGFHTLKAVLVYLYRFLMYDKSASGSPGLLGGPICRRRFSATTPSSPSLGPQVSRCLESLNRHIDQMESRARAAAPATPTLSCALWNLLLLRALLKSRVLRYLDAADLEKALTHCPPDRTYEVYLAHLSLMRECATNSPGVFLTREAKAGAASVVTYIRLLRQYLAAAPPEELLPFNYFSGFFASLEPTASDIKTVSEIIESWTEKMAHSTGVLPNMTWHVEARNHGALETTLAAERLLEGQAVSL